MNILAAPALFIASCFVCSTCLCAPFLVSDPYPLTGIQPATFNVQLDSATAVSVSAFANPDGSKQLRYDVGALTMANGSHQFKVTAVAPSGVSATINFPFTWPLSPAVAPPASPANLRLISQ